MKAFLNIQLVESHEQVAFQTDSESHIKKLYPEVNTFSLDNFSDVSMVTYAQELINQAEKILILMESYDSKANPNKLLKLINTLVREKSRRVKLILSGQNLIIEKMAKTLGDNFYNQPTEKHLMNVAEELFS